MKSIFFDFLAHKKNLSKEDFDEILKMYKTTNTDNINTRLDILKRFRILRKNGNNDTPKSEIKAMKKLLKEWIPIKAVPISYIKYSEMI